MASTAQQHKLYWTKDAFSLNYTIFEGSNVVGIIKDNSLSRSVKASIFGKKYLFESNGFIKPRIQMIDLGNKEVVGQIKAKTIRPRALVNYSGSIYQWKFDNMMYTKWSFLDQNDKIKVSGSKRKEGYFNSDSNTSPVLLLIALIIRNHFIKQGY